MKRHIVKCTDCELYLVTTLEEKRKLLDKPCPICAGKTITGGRLINLANEYDY